MGLYQEYIVPHLVNLAMRNRQLTPYRDRIVKLAEGRVLEIGVGSGLNLPLYTNRATEILGLDPHPKLLGMASDKARSVPSKLIEGSAESIPLDDASVDTVVTTWTLCTIPDVVTALEEIHALARAIRVLPEIYRSVVLLRDVEELTTEEAAEVVEISPEAVKTRSHRGRLALRQEMDLYLRSKGKEEIPRAR